jgi:hypothetical protein
VRASLQAFVDSLRARGFDVDFLSVRTSPSASYATVEILEFLDLRLLRWGPLRRWRILLLDAYRPNMTDDVFDFCWERGYIVVIIGGGLSGTFQVNDTHLHNVLSKSYQGGEMSLLLACAEQQPLSLPVCTRDDCVNLLRTIWADVELHRKCARGFKDNLITTALDGSEDHLAGHEIGKLWQDLQMPRLRDQVKAEIDEMLQDGQLAWTSKCVRKLLGDYVQTGLLDALDEADEGDTVDEDPGYTRNRLTSDFDFLPNRNPTLHYSTYNSLLLRVIWVLGGVALLAFGPSCVRRGSHALAQEYRT